MTGQRGQAGMFQSRHIMAAFGLAPALTVLSTQFPSVGRFLFSWLQPTLEALR